MENFQHNDTSLRQTFGLGMFMVHAVKGRRRGRWNLQGTWKRGKFYDSSNSLDYTQICVIVTALGRRNIRARCLTTDLSNVMKRTTHMYRSANIMKQKTAHAGSHLRIPDWNVLRSITFCHVMRSKATAVPIRLTMRVTHVLDKCTATYYTLTPWSCVLLG